MRDSVEVAGRVRTYRVEGGPSRDLVLIFHGSGQTADKHRAFTGRAFDDLGGAVVVYLDGYRHNWNDARRESSFPARRADIDDVAFVRAVIAKLAAGRGIDPGRVFAVGYSNGGQMVIRLLHDAPELLAGAAIVAATLPAPENLLLPDPLPAPEPVPIVLIHGTKDPIVDYRGGEFRWWARLLFKVGGRALSMPETARYFAARNGITGQPVSRALPAAGEKTSVELTEYREPGRPPVLLYTVHGGGHTIPGPAKAPALIGRTNQDVSTADLVAAAFGLPST
jgi:polyhydroxybutyrate depolymerase